MNKTLLAVTIALCGSQAALAGDLGAIVDKYLANNSQHFFGIKKPLAASEKVSVPRVPGQKASDLIKLADGLSATIVSRKVGHSSDMMAFWPSDNAPTHIISCVEITSTSEIVGKYASGRDKFGPSVQRVNLKTGAVETILRGMDGCDGIRRTPWGTIVATEETGDGGLYEILNPLASTDLTIVTRNTSEIIDDKDQPVSGQVEYRGALGQLAWEGLDLTKNGVVYYGDELRPGSNGADADGGSIYKFVPATAWTGTTVKALSESPLVSGSVYAYSASCVGKVSNSFPQFGQGCEVGEGAWVKVDASSPLSSTAAIQGATGYYRPEDGHFDRAYKGPGVKFCWTNTGNEDAKNYAEVMCMIDTNPIGTGEKLVDNDAVNGFGLTYLADTAEAKGFAVSTVSRILEGDTDFNSFDNLDFQPVTGKMYVIEDHPFGDVFACLQDSPADRDLKVDGCIKALSVRDSSAEPTGFMFAGDGKTAYLHIQHSDDSACLDGTDCAKNDGFVTDDLIKITGFRTK